MDVDYIQISNLSGVKPMEADDIYKRSHRDSVTATRQEYQE